MSSTVCIEQEAVSGKLSDKAKKVEITQNISDDIEEGSQGSELAKVWKLTEVKKIVDYGAIKPVFRKLM